MAESKETSQKGNVITHAEFEELEKKEAKHIKLKKVPEKEPAPEPVRQGKATDVEMLLLKTEKLEGKIESVADSRKAVDERLSEINQEIGELRSSIMEKDRIIREVQTGFGKIRDVADGMEPEKIAGQLAAKEEIIEKNQAGIESLGMQVKQMRKDIKANSGMLDGIRDIKNMDNLVQTIKQKMERIENDRKFTSRTAGKIETMFSDVSDKLGEFQGYKDKIAFNEETMHEIMKSMDTLEARFDATAKKDELKRAEGSIDKRFEGMRTEHDDRLYELKKVVDNLLTTLRESGIKGVLESVSKSNLDKMFAARSDVEEIRTSLDMLREATGRAAREKQSEFALERPGARPDGRRAPQQATAGGQRPKQKIPGAAVREGPTAGRAAEMNIPERPASGKQQPGVIPPAPSRGAAPPQSNPVIGIENRVDSVIMQAEEAIKKGDLTVARRLYKEGLSMYGMLNRAESCQEAAVMYGRMKRLYSRLRIYG